MPPRVLRAVCFSLPFTRMRHVPRRGSPRAITALICMPTLARFPLRTGLCLALILPAFAFASAQTNQVAVPERSLTLTSPQWQIKIAQLNGGIVEIRNPLDEQNTNWVHAGRPWGILYGKVDGHPVVFDHLDSLTQPDAGASDAIYTSPPLRLTIHRALDDQGRFTEAYSLKNVGESPVSLPEGSVSIPVPFNDSYKAGAPKCLAANCHAHLWGGGASSWANALHMSGVGPHLGLALTQGSLSGYSILGGADTNDRGNLAFNPSTIDLAPGETSTLAWTLFWHQDWNDFWDFLKTQSQFARLQARHYTVVQGQAIEITAEAGSSLNHAILRVNGATVPVQHAGNQLSATVPTDHPGEYVVVLENDGRYSWLRANATVDPLALIKARVKFIVEKQQKNAPGDPVDGAYIPYDNQTQQQFYNQGTAENHNEGRERMGMGVLVAQYIPLCTDPALKKDLTASLLRYEAFLERALQDGDGVVYNQAVYKDSKRPYNVPWMAHVHLAAYDATGDKNYLQLFLKTYQTYYKGLGPKPGAGYYMIGNQMLDGLKAMQQAGMPAAHNELLQDFTHQADVVAQNGQNYPTSEVAYEQSIVGPGVQIELEMYLATKNPKYLESARQQMVYLEAFNGQQPDYHQNDLGIRHWDDYWFGKLGLYGDTFPHYWTTITAVAFDEYADATGEESYRERAQNIFLNNMCLFTPEGRGSCAYVYPTVTAGHAGSQFDPWANDQDWALVNWLTIYNRHRATK